MAGVQLKTLRAFTRINRLCIDTNPVTEVAVEMASLPRTTQTTIIAPLELVTHLSKLEFESPGIEVRLSIVPRESRSMQLLPLSQLSEEDISQLSRVMYEAYLTSNLVKYPDVAAAEKSLRSLISDKNSDSIQESYEQSRG